MIFYLGQIAVVCERFMRENLQLNLNWSLNVLGIVFSWGILPGSSSSSLQLTPVTPSSEPASPTESPWHLPTKVSDAGKSNLASGTLSAARFSDIVEDEMTQMQSLRRTTNKSLSLIQVVHHFHYNHQFVIIISTIIPITIVYFYYCHCIIVNQ